MSILKQEFDLFCPRETRRSLVVNKIKTKISSEEATSALAGFQAGPLAFGDGGFVEGVNQRTHRKTPRAWWE